MSKLVTAETWTRSKTPHRADLPPALWVPTCVYRSRDHMAQFFTFPIEDVSEPVIEAFVNGGRWMVRCPWCGTAQVAAESDPRFFCACPPNGCGNSAVDGAFIPVLWPDEHERTAIEEILVRRPVKAQNWFTWETPEKLYSENVQYGVK